MGIILQFPEDDSVDDELTEGIGTALELFIGWGKWHA